jgi:PAS domain S-box-containing protein
MDAEDVITGNPAAKAEIPPVWTHRASELAVLYELTDRLHRAHSIEEIHAAALDAIAVGLHCARCAILLMDEAGVMRFVAARGLSQGYRNAVEGHSPWGPGDPNPMPVLVGDTELVGESEAIKAAIRREGIRALAFYPISDGDRLIGKFMTYYDTRRAFGETESELALTIARQIAFAISRLRLEELRGTAERASQRLAAIVEFSDDAIVGKDLNGVIFSWNAGAERIFGYRPEEAIGRPVTMLIPQDRHNEEPEILARIRRGERVDHFETVRRRKDGTLIDISLTISPIKDASGRIVGASKIARDITEKKRMEAERDLMVAELSHRVKNTLATVISIARQSFTDPATAEARRSFSSRLQGLAQTHSRLAESSWTGVSLATIFADELAPYTNKDANNVRLAGTNISLNPRCALTLGLAVHELVTNAAKYGALSTTEGCVRVHWSMANDLLHIEWREEGGPRVDQPERSGFGRLLLERALASDLKGAVRMDFAPDGLHCVIEIPSSDCVGACP